MVAKIQRKRKTSAQELAKKFDVSPRTIQRYVAEPRPQYLEKAEVRREKILRMRTEGRRIADIATELDMSYGAVANYLSRAKRAGKLIVNYELSTKPSQPSQEAI